MYLFIELGGQDRIFFSLHTCSQYYVSVSSDEKNKKPNKSARKKAILIKLQSRGCCLWNAESAGVVFQYPTESCSWIITLSVLKYKVSLYIL